MNTKLFQANFRNILTLLVLFSILFGAFPASAGNTETVSMKFLQGFGLDGAYYKIMLKSSKTGNKYFVWYPYSLSLKAGQNIVITMRETYYGSGKYDWLTISNLRNGRESRVQSVLQVN